MKKTLARAALAAALVTPMAASAYVLSTTSPGKWGDPTLGTGATITWSLMSTGVSCAAEFAGCRITALDAFMPSGYLSEIQRAFAAWSAVANLTFVQVADDGAAYSTATTSGDIRIGGHYMDGAYRTLAHAYYPPVNFGSAAGDIHFDTSETWGIGYAGTAIDIFQVLTHEIGHALGLRHSDDGSSLMAPTYNESFAGPQADDIAGIQYLYGAPVTTPPIPSVPEPSTLALLGVAAFGLARRHKARA